MTTKVIATCKVPGWHAWANAPAEVSYLRDSHRHLFTFKVECPTNDPDREIEFHLMQSDVLAVVWGMYPHRPKPHGVNFGFRSCESIAWEVGLELRTTFPITAVEVWEDDENGARVEWPPTPSGPVTKA